MTELELKNKGFKKISNYFENIKDYYWIDCNGNVFTTNLDRFIIPAKDRDGYLRCTFTTATGTPRTKIIGVHQLVNSIFNGMAPESIYQPVTDHIDGDRTNNKYTNLRWLSNRANASFAYRHLGKKTIITDDDVIDVVSVCGRQLEGRFLSIGVDEFNLFNGAVGYRFEFCFTVSISKS